MVSSNLINMEVSGVLVNDMFLYLFSSIVSFKDMAMVSNLSGLILVYLSNM